MDKIATNSEKMKGEHLIMDNNEKDVAQTDADFEQELKDLISDSDEDQVSPATGDKGQVDKELEAKAKAEEEAKKKAEEEAKAKEEQAKAEDASKKEDKPKQTPEQNSAFARQRREAERLEEIAKAKEEARISAIIDGVGENPYTHKPIENKEDVEEYLLMNRIAKDGKDPIQDYPSYVKKQKIEVENNKSQEAKELDAKRKDIVDFKNAYPDVDLDELSEDEDFDLFCKGKLGKEPLKDIYADFCAYNDKILKREQKKIEDKAIEMKARADASVGSRDIPSDDNKDTYTLEQLKAMSIDEVMANWDKVERSRKLLKV